MQSFLSRSVLCPSSVYSAVIPGTELKDFFVFVGHPPDSHPPYFHAAELQGQWILNRSKFEAVVHNV